MSVFAKNLRRVRELRKLSQSALAERCGMEPSHIAHFEGGRREPSLSNFTKLYKALRVPSGILLGEGGESIYDTLPMEDIAFINLVRDAVIRRHRAEIKRIKDRDRKDTP